MVRYLLIVNGTIKFPFFHDERETAIESYINYKQYYNDVELFEIGYAPEQKQIYGMRLLVEVKRKEKE